MQKLADSFVFVLCNLHERSGFLKVWPFNRNKLSDNDDVKVKNLLLKIGRNPHTKVVLHTSNISPQGAHLEKNMNFQVLIKSILEKQVAKTISTS